MQIINKFLRFQKVYIFFISFLIFIIIFSTSLLYANSFKVSDIEISSPFELNFNKNRVIDDGFRNAFLNLISMITSSSDKDRIKNIPLKKLKTMINSFTISEEKFVNNEYFAKLETTFDIKKILDFLEKKNIFPSTPIKNKVLLIPILIDTEKDNIYLFDNNIFYQKWNYKKENYQLLDYLLPSEDLEDLNKVQEMYSDIESHDFIDLIKKYDLKDYIVLIIYRNNNEVKILSKIYLNNSYIVNNQTYSELNIDDQKDFQKVLKNLKIIYEDYWKKINEINTSIKLPLTLSINSKNFKTIAKLEKAFGNIDLISDFYVLKFDNQDTQYKIIYNGSPKTFLNDMRKKNFDLIVKDNVWKIK